MNTQDKSENPTREIPDRDFLQPEDPSVGNNIPSGSKTLPIRISGERDKDQIEEIADTGNTDPGAPAGELRARARALLKDHLENPGKWPDDEAFLCANKEFREVLEELLLDPGIVEGASNSSEAPTIATTVDLKVPSPSEKKDFKSSEIGHYRIIETLGEGGFGTVYRAEERGKIRRQVAIKIIKKGMDTQQVLARFDAEKNALALMNHINIARVIDSGQTEKGQPFFVMEYVDGTPIDTYCNRENLPVEDRIRLFQDVCRGVQHAHSKAVVHRDLKPANIIVTRQDGKAIPKIIDFGLAKALGGALTEMTMVTQQRQILGTLEYMSPEQAKSGGSDIDTKTDVYALGVILFELLVDVRPFDLRQVGDYEMFRVIEEDEPQRPSLRFNSLEKAKSEEVARSRGININRLSKMLSGELDWIVLKALEKNRDHRYETPLSLAADLERHLVGHEPVEARPPSLNYRFKKFRRKYRTPLTAAVFVFLALTIGIAFALFEREEAEKARIVAVREKANASRQRDLAQQKTIQLQQVTDFQSKQLSEINAHKMGKSIRNGLLDKLLAAGQRSGLDEERKLQLAGEYQVLVKDADFTGLALDTLHAHIFQRTLDAIDQQFSEQPKVQSQLLQTVATLMQQMGLLDAAMEPQKRAVDIRKAIFGEEHLVTLLSIEHLANLIKEQGGIDEAEPLHRLVLEIRERVLGERDPETLRALANLGDLEARKGNFKDSGEHLNKAIEQMAGSLGEAHPVRLEAMSDLGVVKIRTAQFEEARELLEFVYHNRGEVLGNDHPLTLKSQVNFGGVVLNPGVQSEDPEKLQSQFSLAENELLQGLAKCRQVLGDEHRTTMLALRELINLYGLNGQYSKADKKLREGIKTCMRIFGPDHPETIKFLYFRGEVLFEMGELVTAEEILLDVNSRQERLYGNEALPTLSSSSLLGDVWMRRGDLERAGDVLNASYLALTKNYGEGHLQTLVARSRLGRLHALGDNHSEAKRLLESSSLQLSDLVSAQHPDSRRASYYLALLLEEEGQLQRAFQLLSPVVENSFEEEKEITERRALLEKLEDGLDR